MTHEQKEADYLIEAFKEFGMDDTNALLASKQVAIARYSEALINAPAGSRVEHWERVIDILENK